MKPDAYMPFYATEFFNAIEGMPDAVGLGYLRAVCHYWTHCGCSGLDNDDTFLRRLCRIESDQWEYARPIIFGRLFKLDTKSNVWHQKRAKEEWEKSVRLYERRYQQTKAATEARLKR